MTDAAWALTPAALSRVLADAARRESIVECGSGESTVAIAALLAERRTGHLYSLEHDPGWAAQTRRELTRAGVSERASVIEAPLAPHPLAARDCGWYDTEALGLLPEHIDLLLVDGPPGALAANGQSRYPALPLLAPRLAEGALVILDDIHRPGERAVVERCRRELGTKFELHPRERVAIGVFSLHQRPVYTGEGSERQ